jgi:hypothetical protein
MVLAASLKWLVSKDIAPAGGGVPEGDAPQGNWAFLGFGAREPDGVVRDQALILIDFPALRHLIAGVALLSGDEEDFLGGELRIPGIVGIT